MIEFRSDKYQTPFEYDTEKAIVINNFLTERYYLKFTLKELSEADKKLVNKNFVLVDNQYIETWGGLCRRVSRCIASGIINIYKHTHSDEIDPETLAALLPEIETKEKEFYEMIYSMKFLPSSPIMMNALVTFIDVKINERDKYTKSELEQIARLTNIVYADNITIDEYIIIADHKNDKCAFGSCYSMGYIDDDLCNTDDSIYNMLKYQGEIFRAAGGIGFNFSHLRSSKCQVKSIRGKSSGPVKFMDMFNEPTNVIAMESSKKRGANMFILNIDHPDIKAFINAKTDKEQGYKHLDKANISVGIIDGYMQKLIERNNNETVKYTLADPHDNDIKEEVDPLELWDNIITNSVQHAEPGMIFFDNIEKTNSIPDEKKGSTNPCGEYIAADKTVCTLGSINLYAMIKNGTIDMDIFDKTVRLLVEFLSLSIFVNDYPIPILKQRSIRFRPIGVGFMGLHSMKISLDKNNPANSNVSLRTIFLSMIKNALIISNEYAKKYSKFDDFDKSVFAKGLWTNGQPLVNYVDKKTAEEIAKYGLFNGYFFAIAPTGSISFISDVSGGIEPIFAFKTKRYINKGTDKEYEVIIYDQATMKYYARQLFSDKKTLSHDEVNNIKSYIDNISRSSSNDIRTATQLTPVEHLIPLIEIADLIDMNSSKTINLSKANLFDGISNVNNTENVITVRPIITLSKLYPEKKDILEKAPVIDTNLLSAKQIISDIYFAAWVFGIKGITTYTEGSRSPVLVDYNKKEEKLNSIDLNHSPLRYFKICAKLNIEGGARIYIDLGIDKNRNPFKLLIKESKEIRKNKETKSLVLINNLIGRAISASLKSNIPIEYILTQLEKTEEYDIEKDKYGYSPYVTLIINVIRELVNTAKANNSFDKLNDLAELERNFTVTAKGYLINKNGKQVCPICKTELITNNGCETCPSCGWGACH